MTITPGDKRGFVLICVIILFVFLMSVLLALWWMQKTTFENQAEKLNQDLETLRIKIHNQTESRAASVPAS